MTASERQLLRLIAQRVARLQPDMARAIRRAIALLAERVGSPEAVRLLTVGRIEDVLSEEVLNHAMLPIRQQIRATMQEGFRLTLPDVAALARLPVAQVSARAFFDQLSERVKTAIRTMESATIDTLVESARGVVRQRIEAGLLAGEHPDQIARGLREVVGLSPAQEKFVRNYERQLREGSVQAVDRVLVNKATGASLRKLLKEGKPIPEARIEQAVTAYRKAWIAENTQINARAATLQSYRVARRESYASAIERGIIDESRAMKEWICFDYPEPGRARPEHQAMNRQRVPFNSTYSDGSMEPEGYGCKCNSRYFILPLPRSLAIGAALR